METSRPQKELAVEGHTIVYKTYCTGREYQQIEAVFLSGAKVDMIGKDVHIAGFNPLVEQEANKKMLELMVVSVDGKTENVVDLVLDLPHTAFTEVLDAIAVASGKKKINA